VPLTRRTLLTYGAAIAAGIETLGCETATRPLVAAPSDMIPLVEGDAGQALDAGVGDVGRFGDAGQVDAGGSLVRILEDFTVHLNDTTCSTHHHQLTVRAGAYDPETLVRFLGGSHEVAMLPAVLVALEGGARVPYATGTEESGGHGHCGLAWRIDLYAPDPESAVQCESLGATFCVNG